MDKSKKEGSGLYMIVKGKSIPPSRRTTLPPGRMIGSKAPAPPAVAVTMPIIPPPPKRVTASPLTEDKIAVPGDLGGIVNEETKPVLSKETQKIKMMLAGRAPEVNTTGIDYNKFIEGIIDVKKIPNLKETETEKAITAMIIDTKYGSYILSNTFIDELRNRAQKLTNYESTGKRMIIPLTASKKWIYIEEIVDKGNLERNSTSIHEEIDLDISTVPDQELQRLFLEVISREEATRIINKLEERKILSGYGITEAESTRVVGDELLDVHLEVKTNRDAEYWIFIREHSGRKFALPDMTGLVEVIVGGKVGGVDHRKVYAVLRYNSTFDPEN